MKLNVSSLLLLILLGYFAATETLCSQTFRSDFDKLENSTGKNAGDGASFTSNKSQAY